MDESDIVARLRALEHRPNKTKAERTAEIVARRAVEPDVEVRVHLGGAVRVLVFEAVCRRYGVRPRARTAEGPCVVLVPKGFAREVLLPEFNDAILLVEEQHALATRRIAEQWTGESLADIEFAVRPEQVRRRQKR